MKQRIDAVLKKRKAPQTTGQPADEPAKKKNKKDKKNDKTLTPPKQEDTNPTKNKKGEQQNAKGEHARALEIENGTRRPQHRLAGHA